MTTPELTVVPLRDQPGTLLDAAAKLRTIADEIEAGDFGEIRTSVVILVTDRQLAVFGHGPESSPGEARLALDLAAQQLADNYRGGAI